MERSPTSTPQVLTERDLPDEDVTSRTSMPSSDRRPASKPGIGDVLGGKYRLERAIGEGGMGTVYAARHVELGELFAVKVIETGGATAARDAARVLREARATMRLKNDHVVRIVDASAGDGHPYMVMELLDGVDLDALVARDGPLPVQAAVDYVLQACEALAEAHAIGLVHRDVKPANLLLTQRPDGRPFVKVLDFGISKETQRSDARGEKTSVTEVGAVFGSPAYMSPEQLRSTKDVDARTDVWSMGIVLYELLAARLPFDGENRVALSIAVATAAPAPLLRGDVPAPLEQVILDCLQKVPDHRIPSIAELAFRLRPFASAEGAASCDVVARLAAVRASMTSLPGPISTSSAAPPLGFARTGVVTQPLPSASVPRGVGLAAGLAALVGAGLLFGSLAYRQQPVAGAQVPSGQREALASELAAAADAVPAPPPTPAASIPAASAPTETPVELELVETTPAKASASGTRPSPTSPGPGAPARRPASSPGSHAKGPRLDQRR